MIEAPVFQETRGGARLGQAAREAQAKLNAEGPRLTAGVRAANHARAQGLAELGGGQAEAGRHLREFRAYDTQTEAGQAAATREGEGLGEKLSKTTPQHPGTASGPPPGDFMVDTARNEAQGVPPEAGNIASRAPRPDRPQVEKA